MDFVVTCVDTHGFVPWVTIFVCGANGILRCWYLEQWLGRNVPTVKFLWTAGEDEERAHMFGIHKLN
jgi:hypothetical protein